MKQIDIRSRIKETYQFDVDHYMQVLNNAKCQFQKIVHELRKARREHGMTQQNLGDILDLKQSRISEIENLRNGRVPLLQVLLQCEALGLTLEVGPSQSYHLKSGNGHGGGNPGVDDGVAVMFAAALKHAAEAVKNGGENPTTLVDMESDAGR